MKQLYIAWTRFQRRPLTMRSHFGYDLRFLPAFQIGSNLLKAIASYPVQAARTVALVMAERPAVLWIQSPPNILLHIAWCLRALSFGRMRLVADLHNSALSKMWFSVPFTRRLLNAFDVVLVHNQAVHDMAVELGIDPGVLLVLEDKVPEFSFDDRPAAGNGRPYFIAPFSFSTDEPVQQVLEAARLAPDVDVYITGNIARADNPSAFSQPPANVTFTGFLPTESYEELIGGSWGVLCLTTRDGIQLSSAIEAVASGKPMVVSDTPLLRQLFSTGLFIDNSPTGIAQAMHSVTQDFAHYAEQTRALRNDGERKRRWLGQARQLTERLASSRA